MGRVHSATEGTILNLRNYKVYYQIGIGDVPTPDVFVSGSIESQVGQPVQTATFNCHLGKGTSSLSPFLSTGLRNAAGDGPAVAVGASIWFQTACVPPGESPDASWRYVFRGRIDSIDMDPQQDLLTLKCRDIFGLYQDWWIDHLSLTDQGYQYGFPVGAGRVDEVMQNVVAFTTSSGSPAIVLRDNPTLNVGAYWQEQMGLLEALRRLGTTTTGWDLRGMWDTTGLDQYDLVYYNPDRSKNINYIFLIGNGDISSVPRYYSIKFASSLTNVRNICDVIPANDLRVPQRVTDPASIAQYGRRAAFLSEDLSSHIDTDAEALNLAGIMVADLSSPPADVELEMPYNWVYEINDLFQILPDGFSYDANHVFAVSSVIHTFAEDGEPTTRLSGSLAARAATQEWMRGRKRLNQVRLGEPAGPGLEGDVWFQVDDLTIPTPIG